MWRKKHAKMQQVKFMGSEGKMTVTRTLNTTSSERYLKKRTVCIPVSFYESVDTYDNVIVNIASGYNQLITLNLTHTDLRQKSELKEAYGDSFYVLNY